MRRLRPLPVAIAALTVVLAITTAVGWSAGPLLGVAFVGGVLALAPRWGYIFGTAVACVLVFAGILGSLLLSAHVALGISPVTALVFGVVGLIFSGLICRTPGGLRRERRTWLDLAGASVGLVVWLIALAISARVPLDERLGWMMRRDSMNNLALAHIVLRASGVVLGPDNNPVPLPAGMIALGILPGRPSGGPELALAHDLAGMGWTWAALVGLLSLIAGLTVAAIVRTVVGSGWASRLAAAGGSLLVLSWYVTGFPIEFGFLNIDVAIPILLASFLLAFLAARSPWIAAVCLAVASTLILATWSPLVLVPLLLLAVTVFRYRSRLWPHRILARGVVVAAALQLVLYGAFAALPSLLSQGSALGTNGWIYAQNSVTVFPAAVVFLVVVFALYRRELGQLVLFLSLVLSTGLALGALLFLNRNSATVWTYYPIKLAFLATVLFLIIGLGLSVALVARAGTRPAIRRVGSILVVLVVLGVIVVSPAAAPGIVRLNPVLRLTTSHPGEIMARQGELVLAIARQGSPSVVWRTGLSYESDTDLWLLQLHVDTLSATSKLRLAAYDQEQSDHSVGELCRIARLVGPRFVVYTTDPTLASTFRSTCPDATARFSGLPTY